MAPTATTSPSAKTSATASASATATPQKGFRTASIVAVVIFALFVIIAITSLVLFYINRRRQHAALPPNLRPTSTYRPYRSSSNKHSQSTGLLAAETPVDDKASMFSRDRSASTATLSLYVPDDDEPMRRVSTSSLNLVPIIVSPADEVANPMGDGGRRGRERSIGQGGDEQDLGVYSARSRPRSASTASTRYYDTSAPPPPVPALPPH